MTDPVKEKIQSLCPDVMEPNCGLHGEQQEQYCSACGTERRITLAVVLRAIAIQLNVCDGKNAGKLIMLSRGRQAVWDLLKDYEDQDEATKAFIGALLGV